MQSTTARFLLRHVSRKGIVTATTSQINVVRPLSSMAVAAADEATGSSTGSIRSEQSSSADPAWMKNAVQQILQSYDNNLKVAQQQHLNQDASSTHCSSKKTVVSDEDLDKSLQYFQVSDMRDSTKAFRVKSTRARRTCTEGNPI